MPVTIKTLQKFKDEQKKFATITAYDASFAKIFDNAGISAILIGDSLGNTIQGHKDTLQVTVDDIAYHTACVRRGVENALVIADMPFMSYYDTKTACESATKLMRAGANMVKLEGGAYLCETITTLVKNGIPVCGHLGLTPQSVNVLGGYRIQGRSEATAKELIDNCLAIEKAGVSAIVIECVPADLGKRITKTLKIPVIGIGAGKDTDGQILVMHDALGINLGKAPSFAKNYLALTGNYTDAIKLYISEVEQGIYPDTEHSFN